MIWDAALPVLLSGGELASDAHLASSSASDRNGVPPLGLVSLGSQQLSEMFDVNLGYLPIHTMPP